MESDTTERRLAAYEKNLFSATGSFFLETSSITGCDHDQSIVLYNHILPGRT